MNKQKLKKQLLELIDRNNQYEMEKVERYLSLTEIYKNLDKSIIEYGPIIETQNGSQKFLKSNPAIAEQVKINSAMEKLGVFFEQKQAQKLLKVDDIDDDFEEFTWLKLKSM